MRKGLYMPSIKWPADRVERRPIRDLIPYARNARTHSEEQIAQIAASMCEWGWTNPVLIDSDGQILAGHGRVLAARKLGYEECPVMIAEGWTQAQKRAYVIADNKLALNASWDEEMLRLEMADLQDLGFELDLTGFDADALADLFEGEEHDAGQTGDDEVPESQEDVISRPGDVWLLGEHKVLCGDATKAEDYKLLLGDELVDMTVTDPPYSVNYANSAKDKMRGTNRPILNDNLGKEFGPFLEAACRNILAVTKGAVYIAMSSSELDTLQSAFRAAGGKWSTFVIWAKNTFTMGRADYQRQYEPILYGWKDGGDHYWCGARDQGDVWQIKKPHKNDLHPTMKPVELVERAVRNSSKTRDLALDLVPDRAKVLLPGCEGRKARVLHDLRLARKFEEPLPVRVRIRQQRQKTVQRAVGPAGRRTHWRITHRADRRLERMAPLVFEHVERGHRLEHRDIDLLALAAAQAVQQRQHDCVGGMHATDLVGNDGRNEPGLATDHLLQHRQARGGLDDVVVGRAPAIRALVAIAGDMAVDQCGVLRRQGRVVQAEPVGRRRAQRMQQHIGATEQALQHGPTLRALEVDHDAALAAVAGHEEGAHAWRAAWPDRAREVAFGRLELDHLGTHVAQILAGQRAEDHRGDLQHPDAFERSC
jgi:hypothetical protein